MADAIEPAAQAESLVYPDSRSSCFHARRALELAVHWLYKHDAALKLPYQDHVSALIHAPSFRNTVGPAIFAKIKVVKDLGNLAVHSHKAVRQLDALTATKELFHFMFWLTCTYARGAKRHQESQTGVLKGPNLHGHERPLILRVFRLSVHGLLFPR